MHALAVHVGTSAHQSWFLLTHTHSPSTDLSHALRLIRLSTVCHCVVCLQPHAGGCCGCVRCCSQNACFHQRCSQGQWCFAVNGLDVFWWESDAVSRGGLQSVNNVAYQVTTREGCGYLGGMASVASVAKSVTRNVCLCSDLTTANHLMNRKDALGRAIFVAVLLRVSL